MGSTGHADVFRILIATDNHLGFAENEPERENDSFNTFEEILEIAQENGVDFILLGGDLFHENKPSRQTVIKCMNLLRKYTLGDKPVEFNYLSDPAINFPQMKNPTVNFLDPNLNIGIPVFSIHGNHDDPTGQGQFCALDMLSTAGLVNYFGRANDLKEININPILLQKGQAKLALYGLSAVREERLFRLFQQRKVNLLRPNEDIDDWCNIMLVHQNHAEHGQTNYLPEHFLHEFLDLVFWGHEHECLIKPTASRSKSFFITQPGSSVATSLCPGEAVDKHVGILEVTTQKSFRMIPIPLKTVRPLIFDDLCLADHDLPTHVFDSEGDENPIQEFVGKYIKKMIKKAKEKLTGHPRQPQKPLIRLRVEYTSETQMFNITRFGHLFVDHVANPSTMIKFKRQKKDEKKDDIGLDNDVLDAIFAEQDVHEQKVENLVETYFANLDDDQQKLQLLTESGMAMAVTNFVEKDDKDAISHLVKYQIDRVTKHLMHLKDLDEADIENEVVNYKEERNRKYKNEEQDEMESILSAPERTKERQKARPGDNDDVEMLGESGSDEEFAPIEQPARGRGRGPRGARGGRGRGKASPKKNPLNITGLNDSAVGRGRGGRGRGRANSKPTTRTILDSFARSSKPRQMSSRRPTSTKSSSYFESDSE